MIVREFGQLPTAFEVALGHDDARVCGGDLPFGPGDVGGVERRIDADQEIALLDQRALAKVNFVDRAGDARANFNALDGFKPARKLLGRSNVARGHDRHRSHHRGSRFWELGLGPAGLDVQEGHAYGNADQDQGNARSQ